MNLSSVLKLRFGKTFTTEQESSRCRERFSFLDVVKNLKFADFSFNKKSEYASICLYVYSNSLFYAIVSVLVLRCKNTTIFRIGKKENAFGCKNTAEGLV